MDRFTKYPSLTNSYQQKFIDKLLDYGLTEGTWYAQEKVHGANFSITSDGLEVKAARRSGYIGHAEDFYGSAWVVPQYASAVKQIANDYVAEVTVFGEICGGRYNGVSKGTMVQRGVEYSPTNEFLVFDIRINGVFVRFSEVIALAHIYGLKIAPVLTKGSFEHCLRYPNEFDSKVPAMLGLEPLPEGSNVCEGTVVRPDEDRNIGPNQEGHSRVILKNKNSKFSEKDMKPATIVNHEMTEEMNDAYSEISCYLTENRLDCVLSKLSLEEQTPKSFGNILGLLLKDAMEAATADNANAEVELQFFNLEQHQRKAISKLVAQDATKLVRLKLNLTRG